MGGGGEAGERGVGGGGGGAGGGGGGPGGRAGGCGTTAKQCFFGDFFSNWRKCIVFLVFNRQISGKSQISL